MDEHSIDKAPDAAADWPDQIYSLLKTHNNPFKTLKNSINSYKKRFTTWTSSFETYNRIGKTCNNLSNTATHSNPQLLLIATPQEPVKHL